MNIVIQNIVNLLFVLSCFKISVKLPFSYIFANIPWQKTWQQSGFALLRTASIMLVGKFLLLPYTPLLHLLLNIQHL